MTRSRRDWLGDGYYNGSIAEYDIAQANISTMKARGKISDELYHQLVCTPKDKRNITVGLYIRDGKISGEDRKSSIKYYVDSFLRANGIDDSDILEIANDAVFVYNKRPVHTVFDTYVEFKMKRVYSDLLKYKTFNVYYNDVDGTLNQRGFPLKLIGEKDICWRLLKRIMRQRSLNSDKRGLVESINKLKKAILDDKSNLDYDLFLNLSQHLL